MRGAMLWAVVIAAVLVSSVSQATTLRKLSVEDLVAHADTVVVGKCEKVETVWLARKIYTIATIRVSESVKGKVDPNNTIKVYMLGGRVRKPMPVKMHVPGAAKVAKGEEMLLFLKAGGPKKEHHRFVGMTQGRIPIKTDPNTGRKDICYAEAIKGVRMVDREGRLLAPGVGLEAADEGTLQGFLGRIKQIMAQQEAEKAAQQKDLPKDAAGKQKGGAK